MLPHFLKDSFMEKRLNWKSRIGFTFMAGSNGGAVFLFPYVVMSLTVGLALLLAEVTLGRMGRGSVVTTFRRIGGKGWAVWGYLGVLTGFCVLSFYSAIGGWTIAYLVDALFSPEFLSDKTQLAQHFGAFVSSPVERMGKILMPLLLVMVLAIIIWSLTLPNSGGGLKYLFSWNPSAFNFQSLLMAMGFTFFSLCVGCGCMMTYGSYLGKTEDLSVSCASIVFLTTLSSILGGLLVMPAVFAFGLDPASGPNLTFITMPYVFAQFSFGQVLAVAFFLCLLFAAITSAVSMLELVVAFLVDELRFGRRSACLVSTVALIVVGTLCGLSFGPLADFKIFNRTIFDTFDYFTSNLSLPIGGLVVCALAGYKVWPAFTEELASGATLKNVACLTVTRQAASESFSNASIRRFLNPVLRWLRLTSAALRPSQLEKTDSFPYAEIRYSESLVSFTRVMPAKDLKPCDGLRRRLPGKPLA